MNVPQVKPRITQRVKDADVTGIQSPKPSVLRLVDGFEHQDNLNHYLEKDYKRGSAVVMTADLEFLDVVVSESRMLHQSECPRAAP